MLDTLGSNANHATGLFSTVALWILLRGKAICVKAPIQAIKPWGNERERKSLQQCKMACYRWDMDNMYTLLQHTA